MSNRATVMLMRLALEWFPAWSPERGRPRVLNLEQALRLSLMRLRRNATYQDLQEDFGIAASTAWEYHQQMAAFLADVLGTDDADLPTLLAGRVFLVDGTLVPTFHWRHRSDLLSGKHRRRGMNVQVLVDVHGRLINASAAFPGSWHDIHALRESGWLSHFAAAAKALGDTGYIGEGDHVAIPIKKKSGIDLTEHQRDFNTHFAKLRVGAEWGIAHLKNWRITSTRYRSELDRLNTDIAAVVGLQKLNETHTERRLDLSRIRKAVSE
jgi:DDE superfamily endonuclease/Helix-turn-helix of DDE superfamily endonuclease